MKKTKQQKRLDALEGQYARLETSRLLHKQAECHHTEVNVKVFLHDRDNNDPYHISMYSPRGKCWVAKLVCASCGKHLTTGTLDVQVGCKEES